jgi:hypothetical protein
MSMLASILVLDLTGDGYASGGAMYMRLAGLG